MVLQHQGIGGQGQGGLPEGKGSDDKAVHGGNAAYRLAMNIRKTQKRANALKNITIPTYTVLVKDISNALEEKEREEFTRLKVIKRNMNKKHNGSGYRGCYGKSQEAG